MPKEKNDPYYSKGVSISAEQKEEPKIVLNMINPEAETSIMKKQLKQET